MNLLLDLGLGWWLGWGRGGTDKLLFSDFLKFLSWQLLELDTCYNLPNEVVYYLLQFAWSDQPLLKWTKLNSKWLWRKRKIIKEILYLFWNTIHYWISHGATHVEFLSKTVLLMMAPNWQYLMSNVFSSSNKNVEYFSGVICKPILLTSQHCAYRVK